MQKSSMIVRHRLFDRLCHWFIVVTAFFTILSGFSFLYPSFQWMGAVLGSPQLARVLHPFTGVLMCFTWMLLLIRYYKHNKFQKQDAAWMAHMKDVMLDNEDKIPPAGHYNAGQKMLFRMFILTSVVLTVTGFIMWQPYFAPHFSPEVVQWAIFFHALCAITLLLGLIVHVWMATWIEGSIAGMLYGKVSRAWVRKHHPLMLDESEQEKH